MADLNPFYDVKTLPMPTPDPKFTMSTIGEQVFYGGVRILFEGGGYILLGNCGKDSNNQTMFGMILNDGTNDTEFIGLQKGGF